MKKLVSYINAGILNVSIHELAMILLNISAFVYCGNCLRFCYLWVITAICDALIIGAHGAWTIENPKAQDENVRLPFVTPTPIVARCVAYVFLFVLAIEHREDLLLASLAWYTIVTAAICHAFYCILLTMHAANQSWLEGTNGRIGTPNWISITRMALSILVPHIYATQPFDGTSAWIATITLILAILTDAVDGILARKLHQTTKAGKALDPLGDKVIFYPTAIAFVIASQFTAFLPNLPLIVIFFISLTMMFGRDALFFVWFFRFYSKLKDGIGASIVDKLRMATMCLWLGVSAFSMTMPDIQGRLAITGLICLVIIAILSIISIVVDQRRVKSILAAD